jgi:hypothetical protein
VRCCEGWRAVALKFKASESWVRWGKDKRSDQRELAPSRARNRTPEWLTLAAPSDPSAALPHPADRVAVNSLRFSD